MTILKQMRFATKQCQNEMDIVLNVIALKKLKLGYPEKLSKKCQRLLNIELSSQIYVVWFKRNCVDIGHGC